MQHDHSIRLGREYYSKTTQICRWLCKRFDDEYTVWKWSIEAENSPYTIQQDFGYTTVAFVFTTDLQAFKEWLKTI